MTAVLVAVALLQYRWSMETAETARARIASDLQSFMMDWGLDLFEDLSSICVALQIEPDSGASEDWKIYLDRYRGWRRTSDEKELVRSVLIWETSRAQDPALFRLDAEGAGWREERVGDDLRPLLQRLAKNSSSLDVAWRAWELPRAGDGGSGSASPPAEAKGATIGWQFDPVVPAIVHPIIHRPLPHEKLPPPDRAKVDWIVIVVDSEVLRTEILPQLAKQHFSGGKDKYLLTVSAPTFPGGVFYSSGEPAGQPNGNEPARHPDAEMNIFGPPPAAIGDQPLQSVVTAVSIRSSGERRLSSPAWFPVMQYAPPEQPWTLAVTDLSEPMEASFARIRNKNLLVSALVLAVLALAMGLTVKAAYHARVIAQQQIDFVAAVSHELGTSLAVISSAAENMADGVVATPQGVRQYGSLLRDQGRQMTELIDDVLAFASMRSGRTRYNLRLVSIANLVETYLEHSGDLIRDAGFTVEWNPEPGLPPVEADPQAFTRCLQNLVGNAIKYGKPGGWVGIRAFVGDGQLSRSREVCVSVADRGMGIANSELRQVFRPFYRSPAVTVAQIRGTGLGLAITRNIVEGMGGKITVSSEIGVGTVFTLHLPAADAKAPVAVPVASGSVRQL